MIDKSENLLKSRVSIRMSCERIVQFLACLLISIVVITIIFFTSQQATSWYYWNANTIATSTSNIIIAPLREDIIYQKDDKNNIRYINNENHIEFISSSIDFFYNSENKVELPRHFHTRHGDGTTTRDAENEVLSEILNKRNVFNDTFLTTKKLLSSPQPLPSPVPPHQPPQSSAQQQQQTLPSIGTTHPFTVEDFEDDEDNGQDLQTIETKKIKNFNNHLLQTKSRVVTDRFQPLATITTVTKFSQENFSEPHIDGKLLFG